MEQNATVLEWKCPCCNAGLKFDGSQQQLTCEYCGNSFEADAVRAFQETENQKDTDTFEWEAEQTQTWSEEEQKQLHTFLCPSCGGQILCEETTGATFCPYCDNPTILPDRMDGGLKPDGVIPFQTTKEDAKAAFLQLCKSKPLLPKFFTQEQRLERITGMYVPFWLYDCDGSFDGSYKATRIHHWSDSRYHYTRTEHFLLRRSGTASFAGIPMDGSSKMDDTFMESLEPFDYGKLTDFDMAYLTGFLADKYDVPSEDGQERIRQRVEQSMGDYIQGTMVGFSTVIPTSRQLKVEHGNARYVLLPVWILNTNYNGKCYTFAMNGQTGKMTGAFPICPKRTAAWFSGIFAAVTVLATLIQWIL